MAAENSPQSIRVDIAGREYQIDCNDNNRETLVKAASLTHDEIVRNRSGATATNQVPLDTAAVMTALNFAGELVERNRRDSETAEKDCKMIDRLIDELDQVI